MASKDTTFRLTSRKWHACLRLALVLAGLAGTAHAAVPGSWARLPGIASLTACGPEGSGSPGPHLPPPAPLVSAGQERQGGGLGKVDGASADEDPLGELPQQLAGEDEDVGKLAAIRLLEAIAKAGTTQQRDTYLAFLKQKLHPPSIRAGHGDQVSAERIVNALGTWIAANGAPFASVQDVLLPLVGVGSQVLRQGTVRALIAQSRYEAASSTEPSATVVASLRDEFLAANLPPDEFVRDAAEILWSIDPKLLLSSLIAGLQKHFDREDASLLVSPAYVLVFELQRRVPLAFPTPQEWQLWWTEHQDLALDRILAASLERGHARSAAVWKALLRRLRETGNAESVLGAIQDTLGETRSTAVRLAAVTALGDFAEWVRGSQVPRETTGEFTVAPADSLLGRGVQLLVAVLRRRAFPLEDPQVLKAALGSLLRYQVYLERRPELAREVADLAVDVLQERTSNVTSAGNREFLLEAVRLVGALRAHDAQPQIEAILAMDAATWGDDLELLTAAVTTLGRLQDKSLSADVAGLLIDYFQRALVGSEEALREFRRACVTALQLGSRDEVVQERLRGFYRDLLEQPSYKDFRIGATLGLGGLAQLGDPTALDDLVSVVARPNLFGHGEINAAIDSVAYVGGDVVVGRILPQLLQQQRVVQDHIEKKLVGLIEADGLPRLVEVARAFATLSVASDSAAPLEAYLRLCAQPPVQALLTKDQASLTEKADLVAFWDAQMILLRAHDCTGDREACETIAARLTALRSAVESLSEDHPEGVGELAAFRAALAARAPLEKSISGDENGDREALLRAIRVLAAAERSILGRQTQVWWVTRILAGAEEKSAAVAIADWFASTEADPFWEGFPDGARARAVERVKALAEAPKESGKE